jgi:hypothetical protein
MFCVPVLVFGGGEGIRSRFHVLQSQTRFRRYGGRRFPFLCFALPNSFSAVPTASALIFIICTHGHIFGGAEVVRSRFHVLRARTHLRLYRWHRVPYCFFCAPGHVFGSAKGVGSHFHVLRSQTRFRRF